MTREWFKEWFDSPYYHILYKNRDEREAKHFIDHLLEILQPRPDSRILDLACGKGRFSRYLAEKGYHITGLDLSESSIKYARQFERERLSFFTHDMRKPFQTSYFNFIFNFFTSFGYFENEKDHIDTLKNVARGLEPEGVFVLDFFNSQYVTNQLIGKESKLIEGIRFDLCKRVEGKYVVKTIDFANKQKNYFFEERVRLFFLRDFEHLFSKAGLTITTLYGDYQLNSFEQEKSPRLILVAKRS